MGYENQPKFFREIVKVGWDNIEHEVLESGLSEQAAREREKELIFRGEERVLNARHCQGVNLSWMRQSITKDTPLVRHNKFSNFNDVWMEKVRYEDALLYRWDIYDEYMELGYASMRGAHVMYRTLRVPIPPNVTYSGLYDYLCWKMDFAKCHTLVEQEVVEWH
jgi:hypothetical protein